MITDTETEKRDTTPRKVRLRKIAWVNPESLFIHLAPCAGLVWLDSGMDIHGSGRWSYLMWNPETTIHGNDQNFEIQDDSGVSKYSGDPFNLVKKLLSFRKVSRDPSSPPFTGGVAGFFGYGLLSHCEPSTRLKEKPEAPEGDLWLGFYNKIIAFDHIAHETILVVNHDESIDPEVALDDLESIVLNGAVDNTTKMNSNKIPYEYSSNFSKDEYLEAVESVRRYIEDGDCYQANISQRFRVIGDFDPVSLYLRLRKINPAPFAAYIDTGKVQALSSSPERFLKFHDGITQTRPIKGTRPRGASAEEDERLLAELVNSEKDRAENMMIVDLMRNDLSRVCLPHTVKTTEICAVEKFPTVFHLTSTIEGKVRSGIGAVDLLKHCFPAGSVTGAPKIRAMEIIDELEPSPRGIYCGSIGFIGYDGSMDMSVAIRVMVVSGDTLSFNTGGGVTYLSVAEDEYQETLDKAKALMESAVK